jgi:hypothetical protein
MLSFMHLECRINRKRESTDCRGSIRGEQERREEY